MGIGELEVKSLGSNNEQKTLVAIAGVHIERVLLFTA